MFGWVGKLSARILLTDYATSAYSPCMSKILVVRPSTEIDHHATALKARALRHNRGVSLRDLAKRMKLTAGYLSDLELARRQWSEKLADKFEAALR